MKNQYHLPQIEVSHKDKDFKKQTIVDCSLEDSEI